MITARPDILQMELSKLHQDHSIVKILEVLPVIAYLPKLFIASLQADRFRGKVVNK